MSRHLIDWQFESDDTWTSRIAAARAFSLAPPHPVASDRHLGLVFFNPSLRTRTSMEVAASRLGAGSSTIIPGQGTWGFAWEDGVTMDGAEAEHIREAAGVLSQYFDAIGVRLFASLSDYERDRDEVLIKRFVEAAQRPVINLESAFFHPCQALADAAVMDEYFAGDVAGRKFVLSWAYHPKALPMAVPNSALLAAARSGMDVTLACPPEYVLDDGVMETARSYASARGRSVSITDDLDAAVEGADIVYAKAWSGPFVYRDSDAEAAKRDGLKDWRITKERMDRTKGGAFMHCLPVRRGVVVHDAVMDGPGAIHLRQAAYRLYAQQAILTWLWNLPDPTP